jgi:hypothetical protein
MRTHISVLHSYTSATRSSSGSSQPTLHSQWLSRKVSTGAVAASAPRTRDRMRPAHNIQSRTNTDITYVYISFTYYVNQSTQTLRMPSSGMWHHVGLVRTEISPKRRF